MKKVLAVLLSAIIVIGISMTAFAAPEQHTFTFDIFAQGNYTDPHNIQVSKDEIITVNYMLTVDDIQKIEAITQDEIYYDKDFFELVDGSIVLGNNGDGVTYGYHQRIDGNAHIFFNNGPDKRFYNDTEKSLIGSFKLKVKVGSGATVIKNTNYAAHVLDQSEVLTRCTDLSVTVKDDTETVPVSGIVLGTGAESLTVGERKQLTATVIPSNATNINTTWSSSNTVVAIVDTNGMVIAKSEGTAIITAITTDGGKTATCTVTVVKEDLPIDEEIPAETEQPTEIPDEPDEPITSDTPSSNPFLDVKAGEYYYDAVLWAAENEITQGTGVKTFSPDMPVIRAQVVTFLWRAAGCPEPTGDASKFTDVEVGSYYEKAVAWAIEQGITKGTSETTFSPDKICTRGQIVTFLARFAGVEDATTQSVFDDVKPDDYFAAAVKWAKDNGVTEGTSATTFSPNDDCTRGQIVTFLYRWMVR